MFYSLSFSFSPLTSLFIYVLVFASFFLLLRTIIARYILLDSVSDRVLVLNSISLSYLFWEISAIPKRPNILLELVRTAPIKSVCGCPN